MISNDSSLVCRFALQAINLTAISRQKLRAACARVLMQPKDVDDVRNALCCREGLVGVEGGLNRDLLHPESALPGPGIVPGFS